MHRSSSRRADARSVEHGALPPGKVPYGEPSPATERSNRSSSKKSRPLSSSTNKGVSHAPQLDYLTSLASAPSQWKMGRSMTAAETADENDDWILNQQAPPLPPLTDRPRSRTRTTSAGGSKNKTKSEEKKARSLNLDGQVTRKHRQNTDAQSQNPESATHETSSSLISWGRNKKDAKDSSSIQAGYGRTSQIGLSELKKQLASGTRDIGDKMIVDQQDPTNSAVHLTRGDISSDQHVRSTPKFSSMLSPPTTHERPGSSLSFRSKSPLLTEATNATPRRRTHSAQAQAYRDENIVPDNDDEKIYHRTMKTLPVEHRHDALTRIEASRAKSSRKSPLKTPRAVKHFKSLSPNMDSDDSGSEPAMLTPRARSSSKSRTSPFLSSAASPTRTPTSIPAPNFRSRSSSSGVNADKAREQLRPLSQGISRISNPPRSPAFRSNRRELASHSQRSVYFSEKPEAASRLPSPVPDSDDDADGTPRASRVARNAQYQSTTESDGTSDEKLHSINRYGSSPLRTDSAPAGCSPMSLHSEKGASSSLHRHKSVITRADRIESDSSEQEVTQMDITREDSLQRRKNELVDLVAGLNLKLGPQNNRRTPSAGYGHTKGYALQDPCDEDTVGIAMGGSSGTIGKQGDPLLPNEANSVRKSQDSVSCIQPEGPVSLRTSCTQNRPSSTQIDINGRIGNANQGNDLLKPDYGDANRYSLLMLNADRQREAFGIPPSTSLTREGAEALSSGESNMSLRNQTFDSELEDEANDGLGLSHGAKQLFHALGIGADAQQSGIQTSKQRASWRLSMAEAEKYLSENMRPAHVTVSASSSASSIYEEDVPERPWQKRERDLDRIQSVSGSSVKSSWKKTLSQSAYVSLLERHGETEMRRQEVIWELCETEQAFLKSLRTALRVFVNPLLGKNRTWASGIPANISRLLDWLEDIYQLHTKISSALQQTRSSQYPVILRIAETLRSFVPRLEVYQPYVVRLDEVVESIENVMKDPADQLGEFYRLQSFNEDCAGMSFSSFLWLPLTRLGRYLKYFNELWSLTPRSHVDHLPTFSLLHSATMVVRVMREVKLREEEYKFVKELLSRVKGLPNPTHLVRRERRLIAHGTLQRIHISERTKDMLEGGSFVNKSSRSGVQFGNQYHSARSSAQRRRANSLDSCLSSGASMSSVSSGASNSSLIEEGITQDKLRPNATSYSRHIDNGEHAKRTYQDKTRATSLYAFVFTDLAVFTSISPHSSSSGNYHDALELLDDIGICRVLSVTDHSGNLGYDHLLGVHVVPIDVEQLDNGILSDASATCLFIHHSSAQSSAAQYSDARKRWSSAFERCYHFTLRSLSFPAHSGKYLTAGTGVEQEENTRQTVMSILASGLPLPKSPSTQISELEKSAAEDVSLREREERGWWALRFQQILQEVQRNEIPLLAQSVGTIRPTAPRRNISVRRRLKLTSEKK